MAKLCNAEMTDLALKLLDGELLQALCRALRGARELDAVRRPLKF